MGRLQSEYSCHQRCDICARFHPHPMGVKTAVLPTVVGRMCNWDEKPVLSVGGGRVLPSTAHRQWSQEMQSQRAVPSGPLPCVGGGVNLSRTTLQTACYDDDPHLPSLAYIDPLIMRHGAMLLVVFGGNVPSTWFSSSRHDPTHDPACVAKAPEYYFYRPHEPSCTQIVM